MVHPLSIRYIVTGFGGIDNKLRRRGRKGVRWYAFSIMLTHPQKVGWVEAVCKAFA